jgi:hypothetical protein
LKNGFSGRPPALRRDFNRFARAKSVEIPAGDRNNPLALRLKREIVQTHVPRLNKISLARGQRLLAE